MKKIIAFMLCFCMALSMFAGCAKTDDTPKETATVSSEVADEVLEEVVAEAKWELNADEVGCAMPAEVTDAFLAATTDEIVKFIPVAYIANQKSENGMIYRILCQTIEGDMLSVEDIPASESEGILDGGTDIEIDAENNDSTDEQIEYDFVPSPEAPISMKKTILELAMVDILVDSEAKASIDKVEIFDLNAEVAKTVEEMNDKAMVDMADGWVKNIEQSVSVINGDILMVFDNAVAENHNFFEALSYLGCAETVDGMNYAILCRQTSTGEVPITEMAVMFISVTNEAVEIINIVTM